MLSPAFRVREFSMHDITPYSVKVKWDKQPGEPDEDTELVVFPTNKSIALALQYERDIFENHQAYKGKAQYCGTPFLARKLNIVSPPSPFSRQSLKRFNCTSS